MAMNLNIDQLIGILQKAKADLGGDTIVKLYNGGEFHDISDESEWSVEVRGTKSYYGNFKSGEENKRLFIKYE